MATYGRSLRRGLPRSAGGDAWPPAAAAPEAFVAESEVQPATVSPTPEPVHQVVVETQPDAVPVSAPAPGVAAAAAAPAPAESAGTLRRGLPRTAGGEPWPPAQSAVSAASVAPAVAQATAPEAQPAQAASAIASPVAASTPAAAHAAPVGGGVALRRGLPRTPDGEPWPPAGTLSAGRVTPSPPPVAEAVAAAVAAAPAAVPAVVAPAATEVAVQSGPMAPLPFRRTVTPGPYAFTRPEPVEPKRIGPFTRGQWAGIVVVGGGALLVLAFLAVTFVRTFNSFPFMQDFLRAFPGEYDLPEAAKPGFPLWAQWQHYFNVFLMVLIIKSGLRIRTERRPDAFWTARWSKDGKNKMSLTMWFHQSLDLLWVLNGAIFIVLLFVTGHWMRLVPTSWEVFPNALSALLQYVSLDWPVEHTWVNYNSLQQLMYFIVVFIAAPLAIITGVRMSNLWPKKAATLNRVYPLELARKLHFPTMLFFVVFIVIHVTLVFATGALRNLNHMFGNSDEINWVGFWIFVAGLVVIVAAVAAARTMVLAPIAKLFGKVSQR